NSASMCKASRFASSAAATCRATCSATACCSRKPSSSSPPSITATCSSIPIPTRRQAGRSAGACSSCLGQAGAIIRKSSCRKAAELDPESLINAILKAPVDLLWFGGIGTYVKASHESHQQVGDPANDALRVSGEEVRARVIGEGANLGVTQAGRIEYALSGGD